MRFAFSLCLDNRAWTRFFAAGLLCLFAWPAHPQSPPLTLEEAWKQAEEVNPELRAARAELLAAQGQLADAGALLRNNPEVFMERRSRNVSQNGQPMASKNGLSGLSQPFEIAGQQGIRRKVAEEKLASVEESIAETRRRVRAEVEARFVQVLRLQLQIRMEEQIAGLIKEASDAMKKRVVAGENSRLDGNLARVEAERAENQVSLLKEERVRAGTALAILLQMPADRLPEVVGSLEATPASFTLKDLLESADRRPLLNVLDHRREEAKNMVDLERARVYPDVTVGLRYGTELGVDQKVATLSVSVPLPLFRRNASGIGQAESDLTRAEIEKQAAYHDVHARVLTLWEQWSSLKARLKRLETSVLPRLTENQHLSLISFRAGEIGLLQLILVNRQVLDGERDLLEARTDLRLTRIALEAAAGWPRETKPTDKESMK